MICGDKINLELITEKSLNSYIALESDLSNRGTLTSQDLISEQILKKQFRETGLWDNRGGRMLIVSRESGAIVGSISFSRTVHYFSAFELGFILYNESDRGKGYTKEAVALLTNYLFESRPITRLEIRFEPENRASRVIAKSAGYSFEAINRAIRRKGNRLVDVELQVITVDDWERARGSR